MRTPTKVIHPKRGKKNPRSKSSIINILQGQKKKKTNSVAKQTWIYKIHHHPKNILLRTKTTKKSLFGGGIKKKKKEKEKP